MEAYQGRRFASTWPEWSWLGTVLDGKTDAGTGLQYKRNRYYDPASGRFTQTDPIGLAGGLNAYGFANGDPVNFSDPFGLCVDPVSGIACAVGLYQGAAALVAGGVALVVGAYAPGAALAAGGDALPASCVPTLRSA